eukprot:2459406-Amphidinium_carterae.1
MCAAHACKADIFQQEQQIECATTATLLQQQQVLPYHVQWFAMLSIPFLRFLACLVGDEGGVPLSHLAAKKFLSLQWFRKLLSSVRSALSSPGSSFKDTGPACEAARGRNGRVW